MAKLADSILVVPCGGPGLRPIDGQRSVGQRSQRPQNRLYRHDCNRTIAGRNRRRRADVRLWRRPVQEDHRRDRLRCRHGYRRS